MSPDCPPDDGEYGHHCPVRDRIDIEARKVRHRYPALCCCLDVNAVIPNCRHLDKPAARHQLEEIFAKALLLVQRGNNNRCCSENIVRSPPQISQPIEAAYLGLTILREEPAKFLLIERPQTNKVFLPCWQLYRTHDSLCSFRCRVAMLLSNQFSAPWPYGHLAAMVPDRHVLQWLGRVQACNSANHDIGSHTRDAHINAMLSQYVLEPIRSAISTQLAEAGKL